MCAYLTAAKHWFIYIIRCKQPDCQGHYLLLWIKNINTLPTKCKILFYPETFIFKFLKVLSSNCTAISWLCFSQFTKSIYSKHSFLSATSQNFLSNQFNDIPSFFFINKNCSSVHTKKEGIKNCAALLNNSLCIFKQHFFSLIVHTS